LLNIWWFKNQLNYEFLNQQLLAPEKKATGPRLLHFFLLAIVEKERALLADAYFLKLPERVFHKTSRSHTLQTC